MKSFKKSLSVFLAVVLLLTSALYSCNFTSAATVTTAYIEGDNVNVRTGPATTFPVIEKLSYTSATVLSSVQTGDSIWYQITYHNGTQQVTGYIFYDPSYIRIVTYNPDGDFETKLQAFPASYHNALRSLHAAYPNWDFIPDPVAMTFDEAVALQSINMRKQTSFSSDAISWLSMGPGAFDWSKNEWVVTNGNWAAASRELIAYYMDPRNFLNSSEIYMFLQQGYNPAVQNEAGVLKIIKGTFMENGYNDPNDTAYGGSYAKVIMAAAQSSGVSPYILASKIRQEIGTSVSNMVSGVYTGANNEYKGYYNFFNIGASGGDASAVLLNGLKRAKQENWNTRSAAIIGGAKFLSNNYISSGQDTYYYQDFNVHNPDRLWHQYAQAVHDARSKGVSLAKTYQDATDFVLNFKIPVFSSMPDVVSNQPIKNSYKNNYYFENISAIGLTPSFSMYNYSYDLYLNGDASIYVKPVVNASYAGQPYFNINAGYNLISLKVSAETGYVTNYFINVFADTACKLTVTTVSPPVEPPAPPQPTYNKGDTNNDGNITASDIGLIIWHLYDSNKYGLSSSGKRNADVNNDGKITAADIGLLVWYLYDPIKYPL